MRKMQTAVRHLAALCSRNSLYGLLLAVANSSLFILHSSLLMACSNEGDESQQGPQQEQQVMGFAATVAESETAEARATRAEGDPEPGDGELTTALLQEKGFGVYCWYTGSSDYTSGHIKDVTSEILMVNQHVEYKDSKWTYSPAKYWPLNADEKLTLRAYAPYVSYQLQTDPTTGLPLLPVVVKNDDYQNGRQQDPLWGTARHGGSDDEATTYGVLYDNYTHKMSGNSTGKDERDGFIDWYFHHGMTKLMFTCSVIQDPGCDKVTITSIEIKNLYKQGLLSLSSATTSSSDKPTWTERSGDMTVTLKEATPNTEAGDLAPISTPVGFSPYPFVITTSTTKATDPINLLSKGLLIIPRDFSTTNMTVTVTYTIDTDTTPLTAKGTIAQNLQGNTAYTLNLSLTPSTKGLEITMVQSAFTTWGDGGGIDRTVYNW